MKRLLDIAPLLLCALLPGCSGVSDPPLEQDEEYNQAVRVAQLDRPERLTSSERVAPDNEPGPALVVHGRAFADDGRTPIAGAILFAYHTDREGLYRPRGAPAHTWRLKGWAQTDAEGRFEFRTIRPAPYPNGMEAAHIHLVLFTPDGQDYHAGGLLFEDDPLVGAAAREESRAAGEFGSVCAVRYEGDVQHVDFSLRLDPRQKF